MEPEAWTDTRITRKADSNIKRKEQLRKVEVTEVKIRERITREDSRKSRIRTLTTISITIRHSPSSKEYK